jgi:hypothetical protein
MLKHDSVVFALVFGGNFEECGGAERAKAVGR